MFKVPNQIRVPLVWPLPSSESAGNNGAFMLATRSGTDVLRIIASDGEGWEHVSVSLATRCPTWDEMCTVKALFWGPEDCVVQYHPPASDYVNFHPFVLHLWRPVGASFPMPPSWMVGPKTPA